jgi:hypothetical protein
MSEPATSFDSVVRAVARVGSAGPALAPGDILGDHYELLDRLGGGGMGVVYRARDRKLGRDVAVKVLKTADDDMRRMFEREARATAQLLHPSIVTLHHVGEHEGHPYLVLELLTGETLATRLARKRRIAIDAAIAILDDVLGAIAFAHERGVVHRDLKPSNVFLTVDERVVVLDFGVALEIDTAPGPVTRSAGTPGYMAPEQRDGEGQDVRTDVWAAALLLVECLLGRSAHGTELSAVVRELEAPPAVRSVLARALSPDPARRPASAIQLRDELARASGRRAPARRTSLIPMVLLGAGAAAMAAATIYVLMTRGGDTAPITAAELSNRAWHVNYGEMRLHVDEDGTFYGVYDQSNGVMMGTYADDRFTGWWCQEPSHRPPDDAGQVSLHFVRGDKRILVEGIWTYGDGRAAAWQDNFYGVSLERAPSYKLEQRMQRHVTCPR